MQITNWRSAGRNYRVATGVKRGQDPEAIAKQMTDADTTGLSALVVVTPPRSETDTAMGLHTFRPDGQARPVDGIDAMCAFQALKHSTHPDLEAAEFRFDERAVAVFGGHRDPDMIELDMKRPRLEPVEAHMHVDGFEVIDPPHTYEIPLSDADETVIATLIGLAGGHAVMFTDDLEGMDVRRVRQALEKHHVAPNGIAVHAVKIEQPGWVSMRTWDGGNGEDAAMLPSAFGLGAVCAAGVTMCCTTETNHVRLPEGEGDLSAAWDGDHHVRARGRVEAV